MSDALQSLQNLLKGSTRSSLFQRVMGSGGVSEEEAPVEKSIKEEEVAKKPKMRIGFGIPAKPSVVAVRDGVKSTGDTVSDEKQEEQPSSEPPIHRRKAPVLPTRFCDERLAEDREQESKTQAEWKAKADRQNHLTAEQAGDAYKEWQALIAKQDAIQATLHQMAVNAKKRQTEAKVAELEALERAMDAEAALHKEPVVQSQQPTYQPKATGEQQLQEDDEEDIPLPSFSESAPSNPQPEILEAPKVQDEVVTEPILELGFSQVPSNGLGVNEATLGVDDVARNTPLVDEATLGVDDVALNTSAVDEATPKVDEVVSRAVNEVTHAVDLENVQVKVVQEPGVTNGDEGARTVDLSSSNTRSAVALGETDDKDGARVVHFSDDKKPKGFNYDTMTKESAKTRWETIDRARGSRVSVAQLKAYCAVLGFTFVTPKRDTFAMIKEYFVKTE